MPSKDRRLISEIIPNDNIKVRVAVEYDGYSTFLSIMQNGTNAMGVPVNREIAKCAIQALTEYLYEGNNNDK